MSTLVEWLVHSALNGLMIGLPLCLACSWVKSAPIRHVLMLVVFTSFLVPPLWSPGISLESALMAVDASPPITSELAPSGHWDFQPLETQHTGETSTPKAIFISAGKPPEFQNPTGQPWNVSTWVFYLWAVCGFGILLTALSRIVKLEMELRAIPSATAEVTRETEQAAAIIGLTRLPRILLHPGKLAPMIWAVPFRVSLLLPRDLWNSLDPKRRQTILLHELSHVQRGDYLIRWLELLLAVLFWWHPVYYWARSILQDAEEESCDGLVLEKQPELRATYAHALMDVVDYLNEIRFVAPGMASGIGTADHLKRRLDMILSGLVTKNLPRWVMASLLGGGLILGSASFLPNVKAQDAPRGERPKDGDRPRGEADRPKDAPRGDRPKDGDRPRDGAPKDAPRGERPKDGDRPRGEADRPKDAPRGDKPRGDGERPRDGAPKDAPRGGPDGPRGGFGGPGGIGPQQIEQLARGMHEMQMQMQRMQMQMQQMRNEIRELREGRGGNPGRGPGPDNRRDNPPPPPREGDRRPDNRRDNPPPPPREGDRPGAGERKPEPRGEQPRREGGERKPELRGEQLRREGGERKPAPDAAPERR